MDGAINFEQPSSVQFQMSEGRVSDLEFLPKDLGMPEDPKLTNGEDDLIKLESLEFNYDPIKEGLEKGTTRLRVAKDLSGKVVGFTAVTPGETRSNINMLWVDPLQRKGGLGAELLQDALFNLPSGEIDMDIWGR